MKRATIVNVTKKAIAMPVGLAVGAVAWNVVENVAPAQVKVPMKVARAVGCWGIGAIAGHASDKMFDEVFEPLTERAVLKDELDEVRKENEELKKANQKGTERA